mgnify:CR=1 FL=1
MKKIILLLSLCCIVVGLFSGCYITDIFENDVYEEERYFRKINDIIKDLDFHVAKAKDGKIVLYNKSYEIISEIPFEEYDRRIKFFGARKDGPVIWFTTAGAVDDEWGIMFINDDSNEVLNGVNSATWIGGSAYTFSTKR